MTPIMIIVIIMIIILILMIMIILNISIKQQTIKGATAAAQLASRRWPRRAAPLGVG